MRKKQQHTLCAVSDIAVLWWRVTLFIAQLLCADVPLRNYSLTHSLGCGSGSTCQSTDVPLQRYTLMGKYWNTAEALGDW